MLLPLVAEVVACTMMGQSVMGYEPEGCSWVWHIEVAHERTDPASRRGEQKHYIPSQMMTSVQVDGNASDRHTSLLRSQCCMYSRLERPLTSTYRLALTRRSADGTT